MWIDGCNAAKNNRIAMEHLQAADLLRWKYLELKNLSVVFIISESEADLGCLGLGILKFVYKWWGVICSIQSLQILLSEGLLHQISDVICPIIESNAQTFSLQVCRERSQDVAADASQNLQWTSSSPGLLYFLFLHTILWSDNSWR